jgi:hypothetical protein
LCPHAVRRSPLTRQRSALPHPSTTPTSTQREASA